MLKMEETEAAEQRAILQDLCGAENRFRYKICTRGH